jgi:hypothetical protein
MHLHAKLSKPKNALFCQMEIVHAQQGCQRQTLSAFCRWNARSPTSSWQLQPRRLKLLDLGWAVK